LLFASFARSALRSLDLARKLTMIKIRSTLAFSPIDRTEHFRLDRAHRGRMRWMSPGGKDEGLDIAHSPRLDTDKDFRWGPRLFTKCCREPLGRRPQAERITQIGRRITKRQKSAPCSGKSTCESRLTPGTGNTAARKPANQCFWSAGGQGAVFTGAHPVAENRRSTCHRALARNCSCLALTQRTHCSRNRCLTARCQSPMEPSQQLPRGTEQLIGLLGAGAQARSWPTTVNKSPGRSHRPLSHDLRWLRRRASSPLFGAHATGSAGACTRIAFDCAQALPIAGHRADGCMRPALACCMRSQNGCLLAVVASEGHEKEADVIGLGLLLTVVGPGSELGAGA